MEPVRIRFCAQCLDDIQDFSKVIAFCKQCNEYICSHSCLKQHAKYRLTKSHCYLFDEELKHYNIEKKGVIIDADNSESDLNISSSEGKLKQAELRTEYNVRAATDKEICSIHASAVLKNGCIALADLKNNNLKLFSPEKRQCILVLKLEKGPRDISVSNVNGSDLYAIERSVKGIHVVTTDDFSISKTIPTEGECFGVACWKYGIAVTTMSHKTYFGKYELHLLDYHGRVKRKFTTEKVRNLEFNLPWYLSANLEGQALLVSDFGAHTITCVDVDGGVLFVYKDNGLVRPVSMATDNNNDILVVGQRSHNIHHLSHKGEKKGEIYSENSMEFPGGISFDKENDKFNVQCIGWSDTIQVFDLLP